MMVSADKCYGDLHKSDFDLSERDESGTNDCPPRKRPRRILPFTLPRRIKALFFGKPPPMPRNVEVLLREPKVFKIRNFLGKEELKYFDIVTRRHESFQNSFTETTSGKEVLSSERTSTFKWFAKTENKTISVVEKKAADFVGLSVENVEPLQLVAYTKGQYFKEHHDAGTLLEDSSIELVFPRRLVTFFVYLNDLPENEGHTEFPLLNLSVRPERGSAVVFCNVCENGSCMVEMIHKANSVSGVLKKFGLNIWLVE